MDELMLILVHLAKDVKFQALVKRRLRDDLFNQAQEFAEFAIYKALLRLLETGEQVIDVLLIQNVISGIPEYAPVMETDRFKEVARVIHNFNVQACHTKYAAEILQKLMNDRLVLRPMGEIDTTTTPLPEVYDKFSKAYAETRITSAPTLKPFARDGVLTASKFARQPLGIPWFDALLGGGPGENAVMLFIAPSGGGKTVLGTQMACSRTRMPPSALIGNREPYVDYFMYEEVYEGSFANRFFSLVSDMPMSDFEGRTPNEFSQVSLDRINFYREHHGEYFRVHEFSQGSNGVNLGDDIRQALSQAAHDGKPSTLFVVDWVFAAALKYKSFHDLPGEGCRMEMLQLVSSCKEIAKTFNCQCLLLQQMEAASARNKGKEVHWSQTAECKGLANECEYAFGVNAPGTNGSTCMYLSKGREARVPAKRYIRLDGAHNRFSDEVNQSRILDGSGEFVDVGGNPAEPGAV